MGEHYALREACSTRCILHIADVILVYSRRASRKLLLGYHIRACAHVLPGHTALLSEAYGYYVAEEGQALTVKRLVCLFRAKLGTKLCYYLGVVGISVAVYHNESMSVRLLEKVFCLMNFICRVHCYKHRTYLCGSPEGYIPLGNVSRPYGNVMSRFYTERDERARKIVYVTAEFIIGSCIIKSCILKCKMVGKFLYHTVKHLRECAIYKQVLLPYVFTCMRFVIIERAVGT